MAARRPDFRITCALCRKPIPRNSDILALDAEWRRRYPDLIGNLACECAYENRWYWSCELDGGKYEPHHIPAKNGPCIDAISHIEARGTHKGMVQGYPASGMLQGAQAYLRAVATHPKAQQLRAFLAQWDADHRA